MTRKTSVESKVTKAKRSSGSGDVAQLVPSPAPHSSEVVIHACHTNTQEGEAVRTNSLKIVTAKERVGDQRQSRRPCLKQYQQGFQKCMIYMEER